MKIRYVVLALFVTGLIALAGNNYYQTQRYKAQHAANTQSTVGQANTGTVTTSTKPEEKPTQLRLATIDIGGFGCPSCPAIAESALKDTKGVIDAKATEMGQGSRVLYDPNQVTFEAIRQALGYPIDKLISDEPTTSSKLE